VLTGVGQWMSSPLSFPALCLINFCITRNAFICGDDTIFGFDDMIEATNYEQRLKSINGELNPKMNFISQDNFLFTENIFNRYTGHKPFVKLKQVAPPGRVGDVPSYGEMFTNYQNTYGDNDWHYKLMYQRYKYIYDYFEALDLDISLPMHLGGFNLPYTQSSDRLLRALYDGLTPPSHAFGTRNFSAQLARRFLSFYPLVQSETGTTLRKVRQEYTTMIQTVFNLFKLELPYSEKHYKMQAIRLSALLLPYFDYGLQYPDRDTMIRDISERLDGPRIIDPKISMARRNLRSRDSIGLLLNPLGMEEQNSINKLFEAGSPDYAPGSPQYNIGSPEYFPSMDIT